MKPLRLGPKITYLAIFGIYFQKYYCLFQIKALEFSYLQTLVQKWKFFNLGPQLPYFEHFWARISKRNTFFNKESIFNPRPKKLFSNCLVDDQFLFKYSKILNVDIVYYWDT